MDSKSSIYVYIKLKSRPSVCLSVTLLTRLEPMTSTYQLPNIINPSSSNFKFVTASKCGDQIAFCSGLKTKKWRKLEQHSIKNHSRRSRVRIPLVNRFFFSKIDTFCIHVFFKFSFDNTVTWHYKHASKRNLSKIECTSSGNSKMLIANYNVHYSALKALV